MSEQAEDKPVGDPRLAKRAIPLIGLLCAVAGSVDAAAYLLCGRVFVANMTGNTVLLAISLLQRNPGEAALRGGLVAAFLAGVIVARLLARTAGERLTKTQRIFVLGIESLVLLMLAWKNAGAHTVFCFCCWPVCSASRTAPFDTSADST